VVQWFGRHYLAPVSRVWISGKSRALQERHPIIICSLPTFDTSPPVSQGVGSMTSYSELNILEYKQKQINCYFIVSAARKLKLQQQQERATPIPGSDPAIRVTADTDMSQTTRSRHTSSHPTRTGILTLIDCSERTSRFTTVSSITKSNDTDNR